MLNLGNKQPVANSHSGAITVTMVRHVLEEALEPLKLLANVGRARINLTPEVGKHQEMLANSKKLEHSMMHEGLRRKIQLICPRCRLCSLSQVHTCQVRSIK